MLTPDAGDGFACGGLGRHADDLDLRLLFLPGDPDADAVPMDREALEWLKEPRQTPYGGPYPQWGHKERGANNALVVYSQYRNDAGWSRYLALHRHGGIEVGIGHLAYMHREVRVFPLRPIVGLAWIAAALQMEAAERWAVSGPFEITVALRNTSRATLGSFADGWAEPGYGLADFATCLDEHLLLRREAYGVIEPKSFALDLGDRIEQAFGSVHRRHFARRGEHEGQFDPRFQAI